MLIGDDVLVSTPVSKPSSDENPLIFLLNAGMASRMASTAKSGSALLKSVKVMPGVYEGFTSPNSEFGLPFKKSPIVYADTL